MPSRPSEADLMQPDVRQGLVQQGWWDRGHISGPWNPDSLPFPQMEFTWACSELV